LLLFGEQFHDDEPWSQVVKLLGLICTRDEFIGALVASAQVKRTRALIFIDALNEGEGNKLWRKFLAGMLTRIEAAQWIGLCITVRDSYEHHVIPQDLKEGSLLRIEHTGFAENPYGAANRFFAVFGIAPSTPLLLPEFDNPLFLKLFCIGLKNQGLSRVPTGLRGITKIFEFFLQSIDKKLAAPDQLNYDEREKLVVKAVDGLASAMAKQGSDYLPLDVARSIVNGVLPSPGYSGSHFSTSRIRVRHCDSSGMGCGR
jgi:hypothetical protein